MSAKCARWTCVMEAALSSWLSMRGPAEGLLLLFRFGNHFRQGIGKFLSLNFSLKLFLLSLFSLSLHLRNIFSKKLPELKERLVGIDFVERRQ